MDSIKLGSDLTVSTVAELARGDSWLAGRKKEKKED